MNLFHLMQNQINMLNYMNNNKFPQMKPIQPINNNNMNNAQEPKKEEFVLIFENYSKIITISCTPNDKLSIVFDKYKKKINFTGEKNVLKFIYNDIIFNPSESVKEADLNYCSKIVVVGFPDIIGG